MRFLCPMKLKLERCEFDGFLLTLFEQCQFFCFNYKFRQKEGEKSGYRREKFTFRFTDKF